MYRPHTEKDHRKMYNHSAILSEPDNHEGIELSNRISALLDEMGAPKYLKGRHYIIRAIEIVYLDPNAIKNVVDGLYSRIAIENDTTAACVERDNRTFLRALWRIGDHEKLLRHFSCDIYTCFKVPTARVFISVMANELRADPVMMRLPRTISAKF